MSMTISEQLFDEYLNNRNIAYEIEKGNIVHPDRTLLIDKRHVICEIRQLERRKNEPLNYVGSVDPYKRMRKAIKRKVHQGNEAKNLNNPYVIILYNHNSPQIMSDFIVEGVMYGDISIVIDIPQDMNERGKIRGNYFSSNGILRRAKTYKDYGKPLNKRVSAIAILDVINPTQDYFDNEFKKVSKGVKDIIKTLQISEKLEKKLIKNGKYIPDLRKIRLRVFHNYYANVQLDFNVFNGKYDKQFFIDPNTGSSRLYKTAKAK